MEVKAKENLRSMSLQAIGRDITASKVLAVAASEHIVGSGTLDGNHITRVFILLDEQAKAKEPRSWTLLSTLHRLSAHQCSTCQFLPRISISIGATASPGLQHGKSTHVIRCPVHPLPTKLWRRCFLRVWNRVATHSKTKGDCQGFSQVDRLKFNILAAVRIWAT